MLNKFFVVVLLACLLALQVSADSKEESEQLEEENELEGLFSAESADVEQTGKTTKKTGAKTGSKTGSTKTGTKKTTGSTKTGTKKTTGSTKTGTKKTTGSTKTGTKKSTGGKKTTGSTKTTGSKTTSAPALPSAIPVALPTYSVIVNKRPIPSARYAGKLHPVKNLKVFYKTKSTIHLTWLPGLDNPSNTRYTIEYRQVNSNKATPGTTKQFTLRNRSTVTLDGLTPGFTYLVKVIAAHPLWKRSNPIGIITTLPKVNTKRKAIHVKRNQIINQNTNF